MGQKRPQETAAQAAMKACCWEMGKVGLQRTHVYQFYTQNNLWSQLSQKTLSAQ